MSYSVPAVDAAAKLLAYLKAEGGDKSLAEICDAVGVPRSSGYNILKTLAKHGLVRFDGETKRYGLGWTLVALGASAGQQMSFTERVRPYLRSLGRETGLTTVVAERRDDHLLFIDSVESPNDVRVSAAVGRLYPLSAGAPGKILLAYEPEEEVRAYVERNGLPPFTDGAITDVDELLADLAVVRSRCWADSHEEYIGGVNAVAAPVFRGAAGAHMALGGLGLTSALPRDQIPEVAARFVDVAAEISRVLGAQDYPRSQEPKPETS